MWNPDGTARSFVMAGGEAEDSFRLLRTVQVYDLASRNVTVLPELNQGVAEYAVASYVRSFLGFGGFTGPSDARNAIFRWNYATNAFDLMPQTLRCAPMSHAVWRFRVDETFCLPGEDAAVSRFVSLLTL